MPGPRDFARLPLEMVKLPRAVMRKMQRRMSGIIVAPSLAPTLERDHAGRAPTGLDRRDVFITGIAVALAVAAVGVAELLIRAIALATNLAYFGRFSIAEAAPRATARSAAGRCSCR